MKRIKNYEQLLMNIAQNIKQKRKQHGLTQEDMADHGFNYRFYQKLESGTYSPNLNTLFKVAAVFNISVGELMN